MQNKIKLILIKKVQLYVNKLYHLFLIKNIYLVVIKMDPLINGVLLIKVKFLDIMLGIKVESLL